MKYVCEIRSDCTYPRKYDVNTSSAMKCAKELGRCEGGEVVTVFTNCGKMVSQVIWHAAWGYIRTATRKDIAEAPF